MQAKSLLKDTTLYSLSNLISKGFSLITVPIYTKILSPADYGVLDILGYFLLFTPLIFGLALDQGVARYYIDAVKREDKIKIASSVLLYTVFAILIISLLLLPFSNLVATRWMDNRVNIITVNIVFILIWVKSIYSISLNQLKWRFESKKFAVCSVGNTFLTILLSIYFIVKLKWGVLGFFAAQLIGMSTFGIYSIYIGRSSYTFAFDFDIFKKLVRYSAPLVPATVVFFGMQYIDRIVIKEFLSLESVGIYGMGARLASIISLLLMGFQSAWNPLVFKSYKDVKSPEKFATVLNYFTVITSLFLISISLFSKEIITILATPAFSPGFVVVPFLICAAILTSFSNYFTYGILLKKKTKIKVYINFSGLVLNTFLTIFFVKKFGIIGASAATLATFIFMAIWGMVMSQKYYYVPYNWYKIIATITAAFLISILPLCLGFDTSLFSLMIRCFIILFSIAYMIFVIKIISVKEILQFNNQIYEKK